MLMNIVTGEVNMVNSSGPRTEPWGAPEVHRVGVDEC